MKDLTFAALPATIFTMGVIAMRWQRTRLFILLLLAIFSLSVLTCVAQDHSSGKDNQPAPKKEQNPSPNNRITVEVSGGDSNKPIENASVYIKTIEEGLLKDKKFEINVKTNPQGVAHVPDAPLGRVLIQIVADGWKPYGHWFEITDAKQVIKIHLERPPKWY